MAESTQIRTSSIGNRKFGLTSYSVFHLGIHAVEDHPEQGNEHEDEHAAFRADGAAGQPTRAVERGIQQVARRHPPAIGNRVEVAFAPIPGSVKAHGKPEISGATQGQAEEEADQAGAYEADPCFSRVSKMESAEFDRQHDGCRPEAERLGDRELGVAAHEEFLVEAYQEEEHSPERSKLQDPCTVQGESSKVKEPCAMHHEQQDGKRRDSPQHAHPERLAECAAPWQTVAAERLPFDLRHD